jgi:predicted phosphodiesterase
MNTTTYQIVSDLHIEYKNNENLNPLDFITPTADILILAGDIGSLYKFNQLKTFLSKICPYFKATLYVPGNHEYYLQDNFEPRSFDSLTESLYSLESDIKSLFILQQSSIIVGNVCIIGCTLWSNCLINIPKYIVRIPDMSTFLYNKKHLSDLAYIKTMIESCKNKNLKLVVVTHHCPTSKVLNADTKKDKFRSLYVSDLDYLLSKENVHTWICGHIHQNFDFEIHGTRIVGNQKGKPKDRIHDFSKSFVLKFPTNELLAQPQNEVVISSEIEVNSV